MVTSPHNPNCGKRSGERCGRVRGVSGEVCWVGGGGEESCGKVMRGVGKCVGVWEWVRKDVWGGVWESVWGYWGSVLA